MKTEKVTYESGNGVVNSIEFTTETDRIDDYGIKSFGFKNDEDVFNYVDNFENNRLVIEKRHFKKTTDNFNYVKSQIIESIIDEIEKHYIEDVDGSEYHEETGCTVDEFNSNLLRMTQETEVIEKVATKHTNDFFKTTKKESKKYKKNGKGDIKFITILIDTVMNDLGEVLDEKITSVDTISKSIDCMLGNFLNDLNYNFDSMTLMLGMRDIEEFKDMFSEDSDHTFNLDFMVQEWFGLSDDEMIEEKENVDICKKIFVEKINMFPDDLNFSGGSLITYFINNIQEVV